MKKTVLLVAAVVAMMLLLAGCGGKKCFFVSQDGKLLKKDAPVVWYDSYVGRVEDLEETDEGTKVTFRINKKFAGEIHDGVAGRVVNKPEISPNAFVLLVRGRDKDRSVVDNGAQIPESREAGAFKEGFSAFVEWLRSSRTEEVALVCGLIALLCLLLKIVTKMYRFVIIVGILCAAGYLYVTLRTGWDNYKEGLANAKVSAQDAKAWLQQHGEKLGTILQTALDIDDD